MQAWKTQLRTAVDHCSRSGYRLSLLSGVAGLCFLFLFIAPPVGGWFDAAFDHSRGWLPMMGIAVVMLLLSGVGFWFTRKYAERLNRAIDSAIAVPMHVRFVDRKDSQDVRYETWFDRDQNPELSHTLVARVWSRHPRSVRPTVGISRLASALLCPQARTPIALTIQDASFLLDEPAEVYEAAGESDVSA